VPGHTAALCATSIPTPRPSPPLPSLPPQPLLSPLTFNVSLSADTQTWQPDLSDMTSRGGGIHPLLRFALIALFYLIAYVVEYAVVRLYWLLHADPCKDFAELLSLQNIRSWH